MGAIFTPKIDLNETLDKITKIMKYALNKSVVASVWKIVEALGEPIKESNGENRYGAHLV